MVSTLDLRPRCTPSTLESSRSDSRHRTCSTSPYRDSAHASAEFRLHLNRPLSALRNRSPRPSLASRRYVCLLGIVFAAAEPGHGARAAIDWLEGCAGARAHPPHRGQRPPTSTGSRGGTTGAVEVVVHVVAVGRALAAFAPAFPIGNNGQRGDRRRQFASRRATARWNSGRFVRRTDDQAIGLR